MTTNLEAGKPFRRILFVPPLNRWLVLIPYDYDKNTAQGFKGLNESVVMAVQRLPKNQKKIQLRKEPY